MAQVLTERDGHTMIVTLNRPHRMNAMTMTMFAMLADAWHQAADDPDLVRGLVEAGMGIMRINCAHDSPKVWERMVKQLRRAERELGKRCRVSFDLAGPKLRTGPIAPGPAVVKWRAPRDAVGHVTAFARVRLVSRIRVDDIERWWRERVSVTWA